MGRQLREVLRTYTTRLDWRFLAAIWLLMVVVNLAVVPSRRLVPLALLFPAVNLGLGVLLGIQLKTQFADPRAKLLPGFAAAHMLVAGAVVAVAVFLEAESIAWGSPISARAVAGLALLLITAAAWCVYLFSVPSLLLIAGLPAIAMSVAPGYITAQMEAAALGDRPAEPLAAVLIGAAALAALLVRLRILSEDLPEYSRRIPAASWNPTSRAAQRDHRHWETQMLARSRIQGWVSDLQFRLVLPRATARNPRSRLLLRQLAGGYSWILLVPIQIGFILCLLGPFFGRQERGGVDDAAGILLLVFFVPVVFAMGVLTAAWLERWPYLVREALHPLGRTEFIHDLARSSACDTAGLAAGNGAGILVGVILLGAGESLEGWILPTLAMMAVQYLVLHGVMLWLVSLRRYWIATLGIMLASILSGAFGVGALLAGNRFWMPWTLVAMLAAGLAIAVGVYRMAFRRWLEVEFD